MNVRWSGPSVGEFDVFPTAVIGALVTGVLSLLAPFLVALTGTLIALAVAGWCSSRRQDGTNLRSLGRPDRASALAALGLIEVLSLSPAVPWAAFRGLVMAAGILPLWWVERPRAHVSEGSV
jgi:hypothetical protein